MKYVIYLRVSTKKQDERTQEEECLKFIRNHHQGEFEYVIFKDKITSRKRIFLEEEELRQNKPGRKRKLREGMQHVLSSLEKGDVLVSVRLDRISRIPFETHKLAHILTGKGIGVMMVDQPGIKDPIILGLYAGLAAKEMEVLKSRIKEKLSAKKGRNERTNYQVPYGFTVDPNSLVNIKNRNDDGWTMKPGLLIEESGEQWVLSLMCQYFDEGKSYRTIASELTQLGYKNRQGNPFQHMSIYRILARTGRTRSWDQLPSVVEDRKSRSL